MRLDAIQDQLCEIAPSHNTRSPALTNDCFLPLGHPTNYGLLQKLQQKWKKEAAMENLGTHVSTYNVSYNRHPKESFVYQHYAPTKSLSCHFHPHCVNKDLHFRGKQLITVPEFPPTLAVPHNVPPDFPQSTILAV